MKYFSLRRSVVNQAFTLVELLVVIAIIGTLVGLLLPAVQSAREAARGNSCRVHMTELNRALTMYETNMKQFPGYVEDLDNGVSSVELSWLGTILPYIEQQALYDSIVGRGGKPSVSLEITVCPSNTPDFSKGPNSSYLVNAGWVKNEVSHEDDEDDCAPVENIANGVFFDRTRGGNVINDIRDLDPNCGTPAADPVIRVSMATITSKGDGATHTLMLSESLSALFWNYNAQVSKNKKWDFGFTWGQPQDIKKTRENSDWGPVEDSPAWQVINGVHENIAGSSMGNKPVNSGFPSSNHPGGVNVAFVGGAVQFLRENINVRIYAQLMTSNRKQSDLLDEDGKRERYGTQPGSDDY